MKRIRLLATSDVHGVVFPWSYADGRSLPDGLARIRTQIREMSDANTIVIDNGDTLQGSPLSFYHYAERPREISPVTRAMEMIGYDYVNLGNHDFDYGGDALLTHLENCGGTCLCANVLYKGAPLGKRYEIREMEGRKLAFFALTTQYAVNWESPANIAFMQFLDAYETARKLLKEIKEKENPDYIICIYHGSFERDLHSGELLMDDTGENEGYRMLSELEGIDIMISGHQHLSLCDRAFGTVVTQTLDNGRQIACIDIDDEGIEADIYPVTAEPDQEMISLLKEEEDACQEWLDQTLGTCENDLTVSDEFDGRLHKSQLITFLNKVQMDITGADLSGTALFVGATGFKHEITMRSLVSTYVFPNTLTLKKINGRILREYLEKCAEFWDVSEGKILVAEAFEIPTPMYFNYDMVDGVEYVIKASNPIGSRIISLTRDGVPVRDDDVMTLCINNYRAAGGGNFPMIRDAETISENPTGIVDLLAAYIMDRRNIRFEEVHNIQVII